MESGATADHLASFIVNKRKLDSSHIDDNSQKENEVKNGQSLLNEEGAWAAVGFAVVLILVGVPVWWRTTTVYRAPLPYSLVDGLAGVRRQHLVPVTVFSEKIADGRSFTTKLKPQFKKIDEVKYKIHARAFTKAQQTAVTGAADKEELISQFMETTPVHSGTLRLILLSDESSHRLFNGSCNIFVSRKNLIVVTSSADLTVLSEVINMMVINTPSNTVLELPDRTTAYQTSSTRRSYSHKVVSEPSYSLTITLMLPQPHYTIAHWNPQKAVDAYLTAILKQLESVHMKIHVRTQHMYMTTLTGVRPKWLPNEQHFAVPHQQLPLAINAIEAKLGSFVSTDPALHFIVYVPAKDHTPLQIVDSNDQPLSSNSFVVPRWGGFIIQNPPQSTEDPETGVLHFELDSDAIMRIILTQLMTLLPVPQLRPMNTVCSAPLVAPVLNQWQLDGVMRTRVTQYYQVTSTTLRSLHELVGEISNMVVSDEVGDWVWHSVVEWQACGEAMQEGRLKEAALYCGDAYNHAQAAFFHPSMLALLYFPDNQKYAIYVPLFLPVSIPVFLSFRMLYALFRHYFGKKQLDLS